MKGIRIMKNLLVGITFALAASMAVAETQQSSRDFQGSTELRFVSGGTGFRKPIDFKLTVTKADLLLGASRTNFQLYNATLTYSGFGPDEFATMTRLQDGRDNASVVLLQSPPRLEQTNNGQLGLQVVDRVEITLDATGAIVKAIYTQVGTDFGAAVPFTEVLKRASLL